MSRRAFNSPRQGRQAGFSLLEVLVTVIVIAIGLLGLASLQATAVKQNHSAYLRSQATWLAYDIVDRMRANRGNLSSPAADTAIGGGYDISLAATAPTGSARNQQDLAAWKAQLAAALPSGNGAVERNSATNVFTVTVQWNDDRDNAAAAAQFVVMTQL